MSADERGGTALTLLAAAPTVATMVLALLLFELIGPAIVASAETLADTASAAPMQSATAARGALYWAVAALAYIVGAAVALTISFRTLRSRHHRLLWLMITAGCVGGIVHLVVADAQQHALAVVFYATAETLVAVGALPEHQLSLLFLSVGIFNVLSATVPIVLLCAGLSTLFGVAPYGSVSDMDGDLAGRLQDLRDIISGASAFMVAGALHMAAWTDWPIAVLPEGSATTWANTAGAIVFFWGVAFTFMIAAFFLPAIWRLRRLANRCLMNAGTPPDERAEWLDAHGLSLRATSHLPQLAAMLAPLLAGPFSSVIGGLGGQFG